MKAFINGVPFRVIDPQEVGEWNIQTYEYVTDHPPSSKRVSRVPNRYSICGLLIGKVALLQKQILLRALDNESVKLIHPLLGIKQVGCIRHTFKPFSNSVDAFTFELELIDAPSLPTDSFASKITQIIDDASDVVLRLGSQFYASMQIIEEIGYNVERTKDMIKSIEGFLTSPVGLYYPIQAAADATTAILSLDPVKIFENLVHKIGKIPRDCLGSVTSAMSSHQTAPELSFIHDSVVILLVCANDGALPFALKASVDQVLATADPRICDDKTYRYLWDRSLNVESPTINRHQYNKPSLVGSYEASGGLDLAEELAHAAGQPFNV